MQYIECQLLPRAVNWLRNKPQTIYIAFPFSYLSNSLLFSVADVLLWSGIDKGPPRKEKFPEPQTLISALEAAL
jgi:hypothetical protein